MTRIIKGFLTFVSAALFMASAMTTAHADKVRIALAETPSDELAAFFVALDRAKAMGLDYEWTAFSDEELAIQAILSGQMDIGFGTPYSVMQRSKAPVRIIYQLSKLKFFPVTSKKYSKLEDLNGEPIMLHSRGGGTESIANVIEDKLNMKFGKRSYVPGSSNRIAALIAGQTDATIVDQLPKEVLDGLDQFYTDAVAGGLYDPNGGGMTAAKADMEWYSKAGQLTGDPAALKISDFWYMDSLNRAAQ